MVIITHLDPLIGIQLAQLITDTPELAATYAPRWLAVQLLEGDTTLYDRVAQVDGGSIVLTALRRSTTRLEQHYGDDVDITITDQRYRFVHNLVEQVLTRPANSR